MRIRRISHTVARVVVPGLLFSASAQAASVSWNNVQNITGPGTTTVTTVGPSGGGPSTTINNGTNDVVTVGAQVLGLNFGGQPGSTFPFTTTIDSQNFYSNQQVTPDNANTVTFSTSGLTNWYNGYTPGSAGQSYGAFNDAAIGIQDFTLANAIFGNGTTGSFTLSNLTQGDTYLLQFWVSDPRNPVTAARFETLVSSSGGDTNAPTLAYEATGSTDGQWVTGTFIADATLSETLNIAAGNSNASFGDGGSPQINLLQVRDLSVVPEPTSLAVMGLGALALGGRRRRV